MQALEKRIEALEAKQPTADDSVMFMFIHLVNLGGLGTTEWVRRYQSTPFQNRPTYYVH